MTEHEAATFTERLRRIWEMEIRGEKDPRTPDASAYGFFGRVKEGIAGEDLFLQIEDGHILLGTDMQCNDFTLYFLKAEPLGSLSISSFSGLHEELFKTTWLPLFRRNCWLSGCPIEATAHEKTEWIQGFTREEIETWNLNF